MRPMRPLAPLALLALLAGLTAGCDARGEPRHRRDPGALVVAEPRDPATLDPMGASDSESIEIGELMFEGLVRWAPGSAVPRPWLATSWRVSPDNLRWTFTLREGVRFHDGTPLDAAAVVFSFERLLDPRHPYAIGDDGGYWRALLRPIARVIAVDAQTVAIEVSRPYAPLLGDLAMFPIVSPHAVAQEGAEFRRHPVGTGPFAFDSWTEGEQVVVHRFDGYWGESPALDRIVFRVVVDARQRLIDLESGSVDLAAAILPDEQSFVQLHPDLRLYTSGGNDVSYLAFNMSRRPFTDPRVRRAFSHAIDKQPIVKLAYQGRAAPAETALPPTQWAYRASPPRYPFDPDAARRLLAEAAAGAAFDPAVTYTLYALSTPRPYMPQPERVARLVQTELEQIGVHIQLVLQPYADHRRSVERGEHDLALFGWVGDTGDPDNFLYVLFHSDRTEDPAQNISFYRNDAVDELLRAAQTDADGPTRAALYQRVEAQIASDAPWVPLAHSELVMAARRELGGVELSPLGHPLYTKIHRPEPR